MIVAFVHAIDPLGNVRRKMKTTACCFFGSRTTRRRSTDINPGAVIVLNWPRDRRRARSNRFQHCGFGMRGAATAL